MADAERLPPESRIRRVWERFSDYAIVIVILLAMGALVFGIYNGYVAKTNSAASLQYAEAAKANSAEAKATAQKALGLQKNFHKQNVATQDEIVQLLSELKSSASAIKYLGGVIVYQNGEIIEAQKAGHETLDVIQSLQQELNTLVPQTGAALNAGQAQINAYLGYLTCLETHQGSTATCGSPPPLPAT